MITYISWTPEIEDERKVVELPDSGFECPKLSPGDILSLDVIQRDGNHLLTPVKVISVHVAIGWNPSNSVINAPISAAEQYLFVSPGIFESNGSNNTQSEIDKPLKSPRRSRFGRG
jgi:hypothetical protein